MNKNKKKILLVGGVSLVTILYASLAYFETSANVRGDIKSGLYQNEIVKEFKSSDNWVPGDVEKTKFLVTNTGNVDMAVRAFVEESWVSSDGTVLPINNENNESVAKLTFGEGWSKADDGFYYYGDKTNLTSLSKGNSTTNLIQQVQFNPDTKASLISEESSDKNVIKFSSTGKGYDNATYTLTVRLDTVQYDAASKIWK